MAGDIVQFPGHKWFHCNTRTCNGCMFCHGGLGCCVTCGGLEGSLTTHCPQMRCEMIVLDAVYAGECDYDRRKGWIRKEKIDVKQDA
jgi:hypothetical protein